MSQNTGMPQSGKTASETEGVQSTGEAKSVRKTTDAGKLSYTDGFRELSEQIARDYSLPLLNWAYHKLGDRVRAEDLAQEALLQIFAAVKRACNEGKPVENAERLVWKIAHYVWCHYLRQKTHSDKFILMEAPEAEDESDFVREFADAQERAELERKLRQHIARLDFLQREIMISFYIDRRPQQEIAKRLGISVSAVKWHLFETRKKLRKELEIMMETRENQEYVYRPKQLCIGICGQAVPQLDTAKIMESLTKQNICIACYREPKNLDELAGVLGIPKAYLEFDLRWLVEKEFVAERAGCYSTSFLISTREERFGYYEIYYKYRHELLKRLVDGLCNAQEKLRAIGFHGSEAPVEKLLWLLIYRFGDYFVEGKWMGTKAPVRPDGGRYFPMGFVREEGECEAVFPSFVQRLKAFGEEGTPDRFVEDVFNWSYNGSIQNDNFYWFGMYDFGTSDIESMMDAFTPDWEHLHALLCCILHSDFDTSWVDEEQKQQLAQLVEKGFVRLDGKRAVPNFAVFTKEQYERLTNEVFEPLVQEFRPVYERLRTEIKEYYENRIPEHLKEYRELQVDEAISDFTWLTTIFAFEDGRLFMPETKQEREFLTMMYLLR
ncbi:MAG: RNA polymerase sigma factor [Lachnospiraceae bacterium]|nr:RNA polymerase sigma factor [Lachnospiraceae bacterium]